MPAATAALAQSAYDFCSLATNPWQCTSTTQTTTATQTYLPDIITVPAAFGSLSGKLALAFASPAGAALRQLLTPYLSGSPVPVLVSSQDHSTVTVETPVHYASDEEALIGPGKTYSIIVPFMGAIDVTNTHTDKVTEETYQSQATLNAAAAGFLLGDLYAGVPTMLMDGDATFMAGLLRHATGPAGGAGTGSGHPPLALLAPPFTPPAVDAAALAAATPTVLVAPGWSAWLEGNLGYAALASTAEHEGLTFATAGTVLGAGYADGQWRAGGSLALGRTAFTQEGTGDSGTITSLRAGAYLGMDTGEWSLTGGLSAGYHWLQATRLSGLPAAPTASFTGTSVSASLEAARRFSLWGIEIEPLAGAVASLANTGGLTESGSTGLELIVEPRATRALNLYAGTRLSARYDWGDLVLAPEAQLRVEYEVLGDERAVTTSFAADPGAGAIQVAGLQPGRLGLQLGAGLGVEFMRRWRGAISAELHYRGGAPAYRLLVSAGSRW